MRSSIFLLSRSSVKNWHLKKYLISRTIVTERKEIRTKLAHVSYTPSSVRRQNPLLLLHPLMGSSEVWSEVGPDIAERLSAKVIALDMRNHGHSFSTPVCSFVDMLEDLEKFLKQESIQRCDLVGHSMGGRLAMLLALTKPELVNSLTVVDISPISHPSQQNSWPKLLHKLDYLQGNLAPILSLQEARSIVADKLRDTLPEKVLSHFVAAMTRDAEGRFRWRFNLQDLAHCIHPRSHLEYHLPPGAHFSGPTMFISPPDSKFLRPEEMDEIKTIFPSSELTTIPESSHWLYLDKPEEFVNVVSRFIYLA